MQGCKQKLSLFILAGIFNAGFGQQILDFNFLFLADSLKANQVFYLQSGYSVESNAISNSLLEEAYFEGTISDKTKEKGVDKFRENSLFSVNYSTSFLYRNRLKKKLTLLAGFYDRYDLYSSFKGDLLKLALEGNDHPDFRGKAVDFGNFNLLAFHQQALSIGLEKQFNDSLFIGGTLSIIKSGSLRKIEANDLFLFTEQSGERIDYRADYNGKIADDTTRSQLASFEGFGTAINLHAAYHCNNKWLFGFQIQDLGFISYPNAQQTDTLVEGSESGIDVGNPFSSDNVFNLNDEYPNPDDFKREKKAYTLLLPAKFSLTTIYKIDPNWRLLSALNYQIIKGYIPQVILTPSYVKNNYSIRLYNKFGGFTQYDLGLQFQKTWNNKYGVMLHFLQLERLFLSETSTGQALQVGIFARF